MADKIAFITDAPNRETALGNTRDRLTNVLRSLESIQGRISQFNGRAFGHPVGGEGGDAKKLTPAGAVPVISDLLDEVESYVSHITIGLDQVETLA